MTSGTELARAASALVGVPFLLHGRDPRIGLDCVGVLAVTLGETARLPNGYRMRGGDRDGAARLAATLGLEPAHGLPAAGDVLLLKPGPCQHHLAIALDAETIVHAHAGLRRVARTPLPVEWPILGHWRLHS